MARYAAEDAAEDPNAPKLKYGGPVWDDNTVRWCPDPEVSLQSLAAFRRAVRQYETAFPGCLKFVEVGNSNGNCEGYPEKDALLIQSSDWGCYVNGLGQYTPRGRKAWVHKINLEAPGCDDVGVAMHELAHALGMAHEHNRPDRAKSVSVEHDNISKDWAD